MKVDHLNDIHFGGYIMLDVLTKTLLQRCQAVESCNCLSQPFSANSLSNFHHNIGCCSVGPLFGNCAWSLMQMYLVTLSAEYYWTWHKLYMYVGYQLKKF
jgi:hypothetical protein